MAVLIMATSMQGIQTFAADTIVTLPVTGTYEQTSARAMLDSINDFRTGSEAWYWNNTDTEKIQCKDLPKLEYDYDLEKTAMLRAMEIAVYYSHTRPNGKAPFSAYSKFMSAGENIAYGFPTASAVFEAWKEDDFSYSGQGHRRNMLSSANTCVAIGHVVRNGVHFWVQEFRSPTVSTTETKVLNDKETVDIDFLSSKLEYKAAPSVINVTYGESYDLTTIKENVYYQGRSYGNGAILTKAIDTFTVSDNSVIEVSGTTLTGKNAGSADLKGKLSNGTDFSIPVTIEAVNIYSANCSDISDQTSTGAPLTPQVMLTYKDKTLTKDTDYTLTYSNNIDAGYGKISIEGIGNFTGLKTVYFLIKNPPKEEKKDTDSNANWSKNNESSNDTTNKDVATAPTNVQSFSLTKAKKSFSVNWYSNSKADGYEIQYATNKKFTGSKIKTCKASKSSLKIKKLKSGKKYYVRIRSFKKTGDKKLYSTWSKIKKVKVK
ncbi:CAP domain-containing protein [Butyrivibrio sp. AE3004]|uniref:CAP domain-containing protein n=1 Tax=Butyrivibrio sp. AE3004 TaxID=1506994 RepID=UPI0018CC09EC|nr:CAP domain-containing protein [Butyrivibrio sp. AE3004]